MAKASEGRSVGQPTKYRPEYCARLIQHMAEGLGYLSFAGVIRVHQSIMYDWEKVHEEWREAKGIGEACKLLHDEKLLLRGIKGEIEGFSAGAMIFTMKAQHGWKDRLEVSGHIVNESWEQYLARIKGEQSDVVETTSTPLLGEDHQD